MSQAEFARACRFFGPLAQLLSAFKEASQGQLSSAQVLGGPDLAKLPRERRRGVKVKLVRASGGLALAPWHRSFLTVLLWREDLGGTLPGGFLLLAPRSSSS